MKRDVRIMHVITRFIWGGAQEVVILLVRRLMDAGYHVVLVHGPGDERVLKMLPKDHPNLEFFLIPEFRRRILPIHDAITLFKMWRYLKQHPVDLIHTHTSKAGFLGRWAAHFAGVPMIVHHPRGSLYHETYYPLFFLKMLAFVERQAARFTDKFITLAESEKKDNVRFGIAPAEKFITIYSGVEVKRFVDIRIDVAKKKKQLLIPENRPVVGYVARMAPEKGHMLCLKAFSKVLREIPEAVLVLVGGGPLEKKVRSKVKGHGLEDKVVMTGLRWDIPEIVQTFDCSLQTSLWDGLPRAMIEVMLGEKPMVATAVGGIPEIIEDGKTGILAPERDADALARGVVKILRNPEWGRELGRNARWRLEKMINVDDSAKKIMAVYDSLFEMKYGSKQKES